MVLVCRCVVIFLFSSLSLLVYADIKDQEWEQEIAKKLEQEATASRMVWLKDKDNTPFLALYEEQSQEIASGAVVVLHAMGAHADWPIIISALRKNLAKQGWSTLSIQLPVLAIRHSVENYGKTIAAAQDRIDAAVDYMREEKFRNIVLVGHGFGAISALSYTQTLSTPKVMAVAAIGLQDYAFLKPAVDILQLIEKNTLPLLDIYGERDFQHIVEQAPDRRLAANKGNNDNFTQLEVDGADHYFSKMDDVLARRVRGWLDKAAPGVSVMFETNLTNEENEIAPE